MENSLSVLESKDWWMQRSVIPFFPQTSIIVSGPSGCGKPTFLNNVFLNLEGMYQSTPPCSILYCYGVWQEMFAQMENSIPNITFREGLPTKGDLDHLAADSQHKLLILDDLMNETLVNEDIANVFVSGCNHRGFSCIVITQNLFGQGKFARTLTLNASYLILFRNIRDSSQIATLGRQLFPGNSKLLSEAYRDATSKPFGYLVVDLTPQGDERFRLRTHIFPDEDPFIYQAKI